MGLGRCHNNLSHVFLTKFAVLVMRKLQKPNQSQNQQGWLCYGELFKNSFNFLENLNQINSICICLKNFFAKKKTLKIKKKQKTNKVWNYSFICDLYQVYSLILNLLNVICKFC